MEDSSDSPVSATPSKSGGAGGFLLERNKPSVISEGFSLVGDITAQGVLHVEGQIRGTVSTESVNIGPTGNVEGRIDCASLQIKGGFAGDAGCRELIISGKAHIKGRISYEVLSIQRGARVEGELICVLR